MSLRVAARELNIYTDSLDPWDRGIMFAQTTLTRRDCGARPMDRRRTRNSTVTREGAERRREHPDTGRSLRLTTARVHAIPNLLTARAATAHFTAHLIPDDPNDPALALIRQPVTRPITHNQLVKEVKAIYAGLFMVESKCVEIDKDQLNLQTDPPAELEDDQWQALTKLHRALVDEHCDFFLATQHPSAAESLKRLASKYHMPARLWRHAIQSYLELLRRRLPKSIEHIKRVLYHSFATMGFLLESVPVFSQSWLECLGDIARLRYDFKTLSVLLCYSLGAVYVQD